jgi:lysophospholipase L1-like esterase
VYEPDLVLISFGSNDAHQVPVNDREFGVAEITRCSWAQSLGHYRLGLLLASACRSIAARRAGEPQARVSLEDYRSNLAEIVRLARQRRIAVVLLTRPYMGPLRSRFRWKTFAHQYNAVSAEVAAAHDVPLVDLYSHFKGRDDLFADESHFTAPGHAIAAEIVLEALQPLLPEPIRMEIAQ